MKSKDHLHGIVTLCLSTLKYSMVGCTSHVRWGRMPHVIGQLDNGSFFCLKV